MKPEAHRRRRGQARVKPRGGAAGRGSSRPGSADGAAVAGAPARAKPGTALPPRGQSRAARLCGGFYPSPWRNWGVASPGPWPPRPSRRPRSGSAASPRLVEGRSVPPRSCGALTPPPKCSPSRNPRRRRRPRRPRSRRRFGRPSRRCGPSVPPPAATAAKAPAPPGPPPAAPRPVERVQPPVAVPEVADKPLPFGLDTVKRLIQSAPEVRLGRKTLVGGSSSRSRPDA